MMDKLKSSVESVESMIAVGAGMLGVYKTMKGDYEEAYDMFVHASRVVNRMVEEEE